MIAPRRARGWSLVELVVVILGLGMLAAFIGPLLVGTFTAYDMTSGTVSEIDIYAPTRPDGNYLAGADLVDKYFIRADGSVRVGTQTFPISKRKQSPPNETSIGVRLVWTYNAPAGIFPKNMILSDYSVMKAAPILG